MSSCTISVEPALSAWLVLPVSVPLLQEASGCFSEAENGDCSAGGAANFSSDSCGGGRSCLLCTHSSTSGTMVRCDRPTAGAILATKVAWTLDHGHSTVSQAVEPIIFGFAIRK